MILPDITYLTVSVIDCFCQKLTANIANNNVLNTLYVHVKDTLCEEAAYLKNVSSKIDRQRFTKLRISARHLGSILIV